MTNTQKWFGLIVILVVTWPLFVTLSWLGFNAVFLIDNVAHIKDTFSPILMWTIIGVLLGGLLGIIIAVNKLKLQSRLKIFGAMIFIILLTIMGFISQPLLLNRSGQASINGMDSLAKKGDSISIPAYKTVNSPKAYLRSIPNANGRIITKLYKGATVAIEDTSNGKWFKVKYKGKEGFIDSSAFSLSLPITKPKPMQDNLEAALNKLHTMPAEDARREVGNILEQYFDNGSTIYSVNENNEFQTNPLHAKDFLMEFLVTENLQGFKIFNIATNPSNGKIKTMNFFMKKPIETVPGDEKPL